MTGISSSLAGLRNGRKTEIFMPYVNVKITKDGVTRAQKEKMVIDITASLVTTLGKKPEHIHIVIDEIEPENWGVAGMLTDAYRRLPN